MPSLVAKSTERRPTGAVRWIVTVATGWPSVALKFAIGSWTVGWASTMVTTDSVCAPSWVGLAAAVGCGSRSWT